ncbi:MAG: amidase [Thermoproteota archaeon]|jgi:Asp-tRNAAsn/Glu-tRNAGln amidotransferase A subunit and related amidases
MQKEVLDFLKQLEKSKVLDETFLLKELYEITQGKSPVEIVSKSIEKAERETIRYNDFITITKELALDQANKLENGMLKKLQISNLAGIPISLKDIIYTTFARTTMASKIFSDYIPEYNAEIVNKLISEDSCIIGKTNLHEFASGITGLSSYFGPAHNPYDISRIAGGSSSGSAVSVATGSSLVSIGTDTRGSIRVPASFCGIVGFKPTYNTVSTEGIFPLAPSFDTVGIMTKRVLDAAYVYYLISKEKFDLASLINEIEPSRIKIAYINNKESEVEKQIDKDIEKLRSEGIEFNEIDLNISEMSELHRIIRLVEASEIHEKIYTKRKGDYAEDVAKLIEDGLKITAVEYVRAQKLRDYYLKLLQRIFKSYDVVLTPTVYNIAPKIEEFKNVDIHLQFRAKSTFYISFPSYLGLPAISLPIGKYNDLPYGIQVTSDLRKDSDLLNLSYNLEKIIKFFNE